MQASADQVGSLLRPQHLADPCPLQAGEVDAATLRAAEDAAITEVVAKQESIGLQGITDGEFRRDWWHLDFLARLDGVTLQDNEGPKFRIAGQEQPPIATVTGRVACSGPIMADDFAFPGPGPRARPR
jgi:5-methyltetrahydropteroyltriglutamate--homocysteine methyltransferase